MMEYDTEEQILVLVFFTGLGYEIEFIRLNIIVKNLRGCIGGLLLDLLSQEEGQGHLVLLRQEGVRHVDVPAAV